MMKTVFTYFSVLFSIYCFSQTNENIPNNQEIAFFLENIEANGKEIKKIDRKIILWTENDIYGEQNFELEKGSLLSGILGYKALKDYFNPEDLKFIERQYLNQKDSVWQKTDFKKFKLIDTAERKKIVEHSKKGRRMGSYYSHSFSKPLFSLDKKYAVVTQQFFCGMMCSDRCIYVYKHDSQSNNWKAIFSWFCGSS